MVYRLRAWGLILSRESNKLHTRRFQIRTGNAKSAPSTKAIHSPKGLILCKTGRWENPFEPDFIVQDKCIMASRISGLILIGILILGASCSQKPKTEAQPLAPEVTVGMPKSLVLAESLVLTGRLDAVLNVDIRSRVTGYLDKVFFKDGQFVKKGEILYLIDPRPYQAKLDTAKGDVERLEGEKKLAEIQVDRYKKLSEKGAASKQEYDTWIAKQAENLGGLSSAKAQVIYNQLNLDFCKIYSPINGQISRTQIQIGNLINADNTSLTNIVSIDPIYAYFNVDEPTLLRVVRELRAGTRDRHEVEYYEVTVGLVDDSNREFPFKGRLNFVNNQLDKQTGTITMRGELSNPHDPSTSPPKMPLLKPGMFIRVKLPLSQPLPRHMIPEIAVGNNQDRKVIWVIDKEDKARMIEVEVGQKEGSLVSVTPSEKGTKFDENTRIVIRGIQRCREGKLVKPVPEHETVSTKGAAVGKSGPKADSDKLSPKGTQPPAPAKLPNLPSIAPVTNTNQKGAPGKS